MITIMIMTKNLHFQQHLKYDDKGDENDYIMILKRVMTHHHENVLSAKHSGLVTEKNG